MFNRALPALLLLLLLLLVLAWATPQRPAPPAAATGPNNTQALLICFGLLPLLLIASLGLLSGAGLQLHWGTPFLLFVVPAAMELLARGRWAHARLSTALAVVLALQTLLWAVGRHAAATPSHCEPHWQRGLTTTAGAS